MAAEDSGDELPGLGLRVYPNPSAGAAVVALTLDAASDVRVVAYDVLGRAVAVLHDKPLAAGEHTLRFDAVGLPGGVYVVRAEGGGWSASRRVTLAR